MKRETIAFPGLSGADRERLLAIGPVWNDDIVGHRQVVIDVFSPRVATIGPDVTVERDLPYGPDARHRLDVFRPVETGTRPIVVFVHGGAFTRGVKSVNGAIYDNLLYWFVRNGFVGFNVEYRLAPQAAYPQGALDLHDALTWISAHAAKYGGDPQQIILVGHSAGGTHAASYLLDPAIGVTPSADIRALVLLSARLRADTRPENPNAKNVVAYFGADESLLAVRSPVTHAHRCLIPTFIGIAEFENRLLDQYGLEFALEVARATGRMPRVVQCPHHNHTSIVAHFGTADEALGQAILEFIGNDCFPAS
jgi:acetyl esterase/lipase